MKVIHQFLNEQFFKPNWDIDYLFIGTFNPAGGEKVNFFYGRNSNFTWPILSNIFGENFNPYEIENFQNFILKLQKHKIACVDIIKYLEFDESNYDKKKVLGKGYMDSNIINLKITRHYNTISILELINSNPKIKVFSTWGNGSNLKEWRNEIDKIQNLIKLASPSRAARVPKGVKKFEYVLHNWKNEILSK